MRVKSFLGILLIVFLLVAMVVVPVGATAPVGVVGSPGESAVMQVDRQAAADAADPLGIKDLILEAALLSLFCTGFTSLLKNKLGVEGKWLTIACLVFGLALGVGYRYAITPLTTFTAWFLALLFGLLCGFMAVGVYDAYGNKTPDTAG
ncbi:MAG: hypothetical protein CVU43_04555 [Chloroflexi bacterium HGW-Chloroflexi-5]|jgi:hypothetical protein|nr:MAG: hypothetical protein CVU43_04555 [Chloroflexi bacterium HGW-Chloroflexi-5]